MSFSFAALEQQKAALDKRAEGLYKKVDDDIYLTQTSRSDLNKEIDDARKALKAFDDGFAQAQAIRQDIKDNLASQQAVSRELEKLTAPNPHSQKFQGGGYNYDLARKQYANDVGRLNNQQYQLAMEANNLGSQLNAALSQCAKQLDKADKSLKGADQHYSTKSEQDKAKGFAEYLAKKNAAQATQAPAATSASPKSSQTAATPPPSPTSPKTPSPKGSARSRDADYSSVLAAAKKDFDDCVGKYGKGGEKDRGEYIKAITAIKDKTQSIITAGGSGAVKKDSPEHRFATMIQAEHQRLTSVTKVVETQNVKMIDIPVRARSGPGGA